jgi:hypothetical protein
LNSRDSVSVGASPPNPLIETLSQVILDVFASCGRITAKPEGTRFSTFGGYFPIGDDPTGTQEIGKLEAISVEESASKRIRKQRRRPDEF